MADLILTNGDSAADLLHAAGRQATIMPWRDVLHEGPIMAGDLAACSRARVAFLAQRFRIPAPAIPHASPSRTSRRSARSPASRISAISLSTTFRENGTLNQSL
jgi:hypothetical protein